MNAPVDLPFMRAAAALDAYRRNLAETARWADPSWSAALLGADAAQLAGWQAVLVWASAPALESCSRALAQAAGVRMPSLDVLTQPALRTALPPASAGSGLAGGAGSSAALANAAGQSAAQPNAALLDVLPAQTGLQVLRMRALSFRRAEARRLIDKRSRSQLSEWAGVGIDRLTQDAHLADAPDTARLVARAAMPPLAALDAAGLALEGCALLLRDLTTADPAGPRLPFPLLRLALPRVLPTPPWLAAVPPQLDALGTARLFARLSELLPEWAWLFG
jgi:type III secretion system HrpB4-like protein